MLLVVDKYLVTIFDYLLAICEQYHNLDATIFNDPSFRISVVRIEQRATVTDDALFVNLVHCESHLAELKLADVEVGVGCKVFIIVDEVHHLFIGSVALVDAGFAAPHPDGISESFVNILTCVLEGFTA